MADSSVVEPVLTLQDVAAYLKLTEKTIYRLSQRKELPGFKVGGSWRYRRRDLDAWIESRIHKTAKAG